jgi:hypothetical protein
MALPLNAGYHGPKDVLHCNVESFSKEFPGIPEPSQRVYEGSVNSP